MNRLFRRLYLPALALLLLAGCDSSDPIDNEEPPSEVAGTYAFTYFSFEPDATRLPAYNFLDTLVAAETRLQLFDGRDYVLTYRFKGGRTYAMFGTFSVTPTEVYLQTTSGNPDQFSNLLLGYETTFKRDLNDPKVLTTTIHKEVDLAAVAPGYAGIPPVYGTLRLQVRKVTPPAE